MSNLLNEENLFQKVLENTSSSVFFKSSLITPDIISDSSGNTEGLTGYSQKHFTENNIDLSTIICSEDLHHFKKQYRAIVKKSGNESKTDDLRIRKKDKQLIFVKTNIFIFADSIVIQMTDVNEYHNQLSQNHNMINRYETMMHTINEGIWDWDVKTGNVFTSHHYSELLGYADKEISFTHTLWKQSIHPGDLDRVMNTIDEHFNGKTPSYDCSYRMKKKDKTFIWVRDRAIRQLNKKGDVERMVGSLCDISSEKEARDRLEKMIITDELTGLYNRRHYDTQIKDEMSRSERYGSDLSIIMIDIDLFKQINDTYGHSSGDIALKELSTVISNKIRNTDSAYRTGGEEFIIIAPATNITNAMKAAERFREAVTKINVNTKYGNFGFTISLGVTTFTKGDSYFSLNERADIALYRSKDSGRNQSTALTS